MASIRHEEAATDDLERMIAPLVVERVRTALQESKRNGGTSSGDAAVDAKSSRVDEGVMLGVVRSKHQ
jgi:hypothetical protein